RSRCARQSCGRRRCCHGQPAPEVGRAGDGGDRPAAGRRARRGGARRLRGGTARRLQAAAARRVHRRAAAQRRQQGAGAPPAGALRGLMQTLGAFLDAAVARAPAHEALAAAPRAEVTARLDWAALRAASRQAAKKLLLAGAGKGTHVRFLCSNRLEWLPIAFGALRLGAVLVPLSTLWKRDELAHALAHADVQLLVMLDRFLRPDYVGTLSSSVPGLPD